MIWECTANGHNITFHARCGLDAMMFLVQLHRGGVSVKGWRCIDRSGECPTGEGYAMIPGWVCVPPPGR